MTDLLQVEQAQLARNVSRYCCNLPGVWIVLRVRTEYMKTFGVNYLCEVCRMYLSVLVKILYYIEEDNSSNTVYLNG